MLTSYKPPRFLRLKERMEVWDQRALGVRAVWPSDYHGPPDLFYEYNQLLLKAIFKILTALRSRFIYGYELKILDIGAGFGRLSVFLALMGYTNIDHLDFSKNMLERARAYAFGCGVLELINFYRKIATRLYSGKDPIKKNSYDLVFFGAMLCHIPQRGERVRALGQAQQALKDDGLLIIYEPLRDHNSRYRDLKGGVKHENTVFWFQRQYTSSLKECRLLWKMNLKYCAEQYTILIYAKGKK